MLSLTFVASVSAQEAVEGVSTPFIDEETHAKKGSCRIHTVSDRAKI
jgi:hypothetical protein